MILLLSQLYTVWLHVRFSEAWSFQHSRYVGEVERCRGGEDVGVIFGARFLKTMQWWVAEILGEALVLMAFSGQLNGCVFGQRHTHGPAMKTLAVQVAHSCETSQLFRPITFVFILSHTFLTLGAAADYLSTLFVLQNVLLEPQVRLVSSL